jgi:exodeoxyribonuclease V alpha subunit
MSFSSNRNRMEQLLGYIERITFQNPENGYTIAHLKEKKRKDLVCLVGNMPGLQPGETIRCEGQWKHHLVYGQQFVVEIHQVETPADVVGIKKYLCSGLIKGIGPKYAERIVKRFDTETLTIIDRYPERLSEIEGLGKKRIDTLVSCWSEQKSIRNVMIFLQSHGVSPAYAQKVYKTYGDQSVKKVQENPFNLARDIHGIGFKTADDIAQKLGIPKDAPGRIDAGIEQMLSNCCDDGHVCFPVSELVNLAVNALEIPKEMIEARLPELIKENRIEISEMSYEGKLEHFAWLRPLFLSEAGICRQIKRLQKGFCNLRSVDIIKALEWVQEKLSFRLAENQKQAVAQSLQEKIQIITGGPGTGKSTITKAILAITEKLTDKIVLAAPTGRAAKRMTEITGIKAKTIHSLLEFDFKIGKFKRGLEKPLECDFIIIDESSMIDTYLMYSLLKAIPSTSRVIFVGDINQLPSVGPGNVLKDIISSKVIPVTALNEIFRQASGSRIVTNAHKINNGMFPDLSNHSDSDFFFIDVETPEDVLRNILALVTQRLPAKYGFDPFLDIQVLAPMRRGIIGIDNLNVTLQEQLNPNSSALMWGGRRFQSGDKVMQIRNNHKREVYNGDIGRIISIDPSEQQMIVKMEDKEIVYEFSDLDELVLAYSVSVHKYQGSECPCIVIPVHTTHFKLLNRNLLYTAVTRGKKLVILVGTKKAIFLAIKNDEVRRRYTGLQQGLTGAFINNISQPI